MRKAMSRQIDTVTRRRVGWVSLAFLVTTAATISTASAEGGNVRYSWEEVEVAGDRQAVLVPRAEDRLSGAVTAHRMEQAFEALRDAKRPTYGNSRAEVTGDDPQEATAEVHIDNDHLRYAPIIKAEAVYTLTEFGIPEVEFPGVADEALTRADVSTPAYTLTVPLWKVTPPAAVTSAQVLMPDDELVSMDELQHRWDEDRRAVVDDIYAFLEAQDAHTVRSVLQVLPDVDDLRLEEVIPFLTDEDSRTRRTALRVLDGQEDETSVLKAVVEAKRAEESDTIRRKMVTFLGESSDDEYNVRKPFFLIDEGDDEEALEAVKGLADRDDDERVVEVLAETLRDERREIAAAADESLDELRAHDERIAALDDEDVDESLRMEIAEGLARERSSPERLAGLAYIADERSGGHANQAIVDIADLPIDEARQKAEEFLGDDSRERRLAAIDALVERNDVESVDALMATAEEQRETDEMQDAAYQIMVSQPLDDIIDQTDEGDVRVRQVAYQAIGERARRQGDVDDAVRTLKGGVENGDALIRGASARSLGEVGGDEALEILAQMSDDTDAVVRREVALALGRFSDDAHADVLVDYLDDDDPEVVAAAIDAMENRGDEQAIDRIEDMVNDEPPPVRASALRAVTTFLPNRDDEDVIREHMALLSGAVGDDSIEVQHSALEQLGRFESSIAVTHIASLVGNEDSATRATAVEALAATEHDDAIPLVESRLEDSSPEVRRQAIEALTQLRGQKARPTLEARLDEEDDPEVKELLESHL